MQVIVNENSLIECHYVVGTRRHASGDGICDDSQLLIVDNSPEIMLNEQDPRYNINPAMGVCVAVDDLRTVFGSPETVTPLNTWYRFKINLKEWTQTEGKTASLYVYRSSVGRRTVRGLVTQHHPLRHAIYDSHIRVNTLLRKHSYYGMVMPTHFYEFKDLFETGKCTCQNCLDAGEQAELTSQEVDTLREVCSVR